MNYYSTFCYNIEYIKKNTYYILNNLALVDWLHNIRVKLLKREF